VLKSADKRASVTVLPATAAATVLECLTKNPNCTLLDSDIAAAAACANQHCGFSTSNTVVNCKYVLVPLLIDDVWRSVLICDADALPGGGMYGVHRAPEPTAFIFDVSGDCGVTEPYRTASFTAQDYPRQHATTWRTVQRYAAPGYVYVYYYFMYYHGGLLYWSLNVYARLF
jgi:hypothetical protein